MTTVAQSPTVHAVFRQLPPNTYVCSARICADPEDGFTAYCLNLKGVFSEGDTLEDACRNIREAFVGAVQQYLEDGKEIPWGDVSQDLPGQEFHFLEQIGD